MTTTYTKNTYRDLFISTTWGNQANSAPTLSGMGNEYLPKDSEALRLGAKADMVHSFVDKRVGGR